MNMDNDISFDNDFNFKSRAILSKTQTPGITSFIIKKGIVKNEKQANHLMIIMTMLFLLISIYVFAFYVFDVRFFNKKTSITSEQIRMNRQNIEILKNRNINNNKQNVQ